MITLFLLSQMKVLLFFGMQRTQKISIFVCRLSALCVCCLTEKGLNNKQERL